jgi:hypothetical protein
MSGCVIPLAPDFSDPDPNYPPYIVTSDPGAGEPFAGTRQLSVTLADPNLGDRLYVRWLYDYPPHNREFSRFGVELELPPTGSVVRNPLPPFQPDCDKHNIASGLTQHRLLLSVSDRPFLGDSDSDTVPPENRLDSIPDGAQRLRATWYVNLECKD